MISLIVFGLCIAIGCAATVALLFPGETEQSQAPAENVSGLSAVE